MVPLISERALCLEPRPSFRAILATPGQALLRATVLHQGCGMVLMQPVWSKNVARFQALHTERSSALGPTLVTPALSLVMRATASQEVQCGNAQLLENGLVRHHHAVSTTAACLEFQSMGRKHAMGVPLAASVHSSAMQGTTRVVEANQGPVLHPSNGQDPPSTAKCPIAALLKSQPMASRTVTRQHMEASARLGATRATISLVLEHVSVSELASGLVLRLAAAS